jgi:hypothetical protein
LCAAYEHAKSLGHPDLKKLDRMEKLTRRIRSEAGGSDGEGSADTQVLHFDNAIARLRDVAEALRKGVEKTPRQVVSATVIERANELLSIIRFVRTSIR